MKNKLDDVRNHLVAAMEALNSDDTEPVSVKQAIDRAKAMSNVANSYIESVKVEIEAIRLADDVGMLPVSVASPVVQDRNRGALGIRGDR